jgi:hypothetical protein
MTVSPSTGHIYIDDPDAAIGYHRDTLGLTVSKEVANDGFRWITLVSDQPARNRDCAVAAACGPFPGRRGRPSCFVYEG